MAIFLSGMLSKNLKIKCLSSRIYQKLVDNFKIFNEKSIKTNSAGYNELDILQSKSLKKVNKLQSKVFLRVLGSGISGDSRCLYLFTDNERYLFNFGDSSLRFCGEFLSRPFHKENKLFGIFFTSMNAESISGIIDLKSHLKHLGIEDFNIYCPPGVRPLINKINSLLTNPNSENAAIQVNELSEEATINCSINITHIPIYKQNNFENSKLGNTVLAYICRLKSNLSRILRPEKLAKYKISQEGLKHALKNGQTVVLPNGDRISPEDVCAFSGDPGKIFIVIDIPSTDYIESLLSCKTFKEYQYNDSLSSQNYPEVIIHFSTTEVLSDERFVQWINSFPPSVSHLILNEQSEGIDLLRATVLQKNFHNFFPQIFPLPFYLKNFSNTKNNCKFYGRTVVTRSGLTYHLRPEVEFDESLCPQISSSPFCASQFEKNTISTFENRIISVPNMNKMLDLTEKKYPHIYFLGTGATNSMAFRNSSSILVKISNDSYFLMDCGPGTLHQIVRLFGWSKTKNILKRLKFIFISHHHIDHFLGLNSLLVERDKIIQSGQIFIPKLYISLVSKVSKFLYIIAERYLQHRDTIEIIQNRNFMQRTNNFHFYQNVCDYLNMEKIEMANVAHCREACGVAFTHVDGWKLVYSGDTMPSKQLVNIGMNCDLLIHEATLEDSLKESAMIKKHTTISEAIEVGRWMQAKNIILTHFSQRYSVIPFIEKELPTNVGIAFDNMKVAFDDLPYLSYMFPFFKEMFSEKWESLKETTHKRELKETRLKRFLRETTSIST